MTASIDGDQNDFDRLITRQSLREPDPIFGYDPEDPLDYWSDDWVPFLPSDTKDNHLDDSRGWDDMSMGDVNFLRVYQFLPTAFTESSQ